MNYGQIKKVYFVGVGGIGMSALARYFLSQGKEVSGYDKTETELTKKLISEGISIHYNDSGLAVLDQFSHMDTLVVYTPAIPVDFKELVAFQEHGFEVIKRAKALGVISDAFDTYAVAGTHGKTTTSTILAHVLNNTEGKCNAFVGGIATNYDSNCIINSDSVRVVVEADEFDRSFLNLTPKYAIITSMDADHLDIYGDSGHLEKSFNDFVNLIKNTGVLVVNSSVDISKFEITSDLRIITYGIENSSDWQLHALKYRDGKFMFDIFGFRTIYRNIEFGLPGQHNAENATSVFALCMSLGIPEADIRKAFISYKGVKRRFDFKVRNENIVVIDDYAHHPTEIDAFLRSVKKLYPTKKITAVFQPHLYSRTRDFMDAFADSLSIADELFLLPIYPAREKPIAGVSSEVLLDKINMYEKQISSLTTIVQDLQESEKEVIVIIGAGDIDTVVDPIANAYSK